MASQCMDEVSVLHLAEQDFHISQDPDVGTWRSFLIYCIA
jgi:hypothetical protein